MILAVGWWCTGDGDNVSMIGSRLPFRPSTNPRGHRRIVLVTANCGATCWAFARTCLRLFRSRSMKGG